jgi:hypothetical protein
MPTDLLTRLVNGLPQSRIDEFDAVALGAKWSTGNRRNTPRAVEHRLLCGCRICKINVCRNCECQLVARLCGGELPVGARAGRIALPLPRFYSGHEALLFADAAIEVRPGP